MFAFPSVWVLLWKTAFPSTSKLSFKVVTPSTFSVPSRFVVEAVPQAKAWVQRICCVMTSPEVMLSACKSSMSASCDQRLFRLAFCAPIEFAVKTSKSISVSSRSITSIPASKVNSVNDGLKSSAPLFQYRTSMIESSRAVARSTSASKPASNMSSALVKEVALAV